MGRSGKKSRKNRPVESEEQDDDDQELVAVVPTGVPENTEPLQFDDVTSESSADAVRAGPSNVAITVGGVVTAILLVVVLVWSVALIPINAVSLTNDRPPAVPVAVEVSRCTILANMLRAQASSTLSPQARRAIYDCIDDVEELSDKSEAANFDSLVGAARVAAVAGDLRGAASALLDLLRSHNELVRDALPDESAGVWAPFQRLVAVQSRLAVVDDAAMRRLQSYATAPEVVSEFVGSSSLLGALRFPFASGNITSAVSSAVTSATTDSATMQQQLAFGRFPTHTSIATLRQEAAPMIEALDGVRMRAASRVRSAWATKVTETTVTSVMSALVAITCAVGVVIVLRLMVRYSAAEKYRSVIRADFDVEDDSPSAVPREDVLRAFSLACAKFSVFDTTPDGGVDSDGSQLVLHLLRARPTLAALRPFVPDFVFSRALNFEAFGRIFQRLEMAPGLVQDNAATIVVIGLRDFNNRSSNLETLPRFVAAVQAAAAGFNGIVAQTTPTHIVTIFPTPGGDDMEQSQTGVKSVNMSSINAIHMAYSVLAAGVELQREEPDLSIGIAVTHGCALHGPITTHSSRSYAVVSHLVTTAMVLESSMKDLGACILCDADVAASVDEVFLARPVWLCGSRNTTIHEVVMPLSDGSTTPSQEYALTRDRALRWTQCFERYEDAITSMAHDKVEEANADLTAYRQFVVAASGSADAAEDAVYHLVSEHLRRVMTELKI